MSETSPSIEQYREALKVARQNRDAGYKEVTLRFHAEVEKARVVRDRALAPATELYRQKVAPARAEYQRVVRAAKSALAAAVAAAKETPDA